MADQVLATLTRDETLANLNRALLAERQAVADYHAHAQACDKVDVREALETLRDVEQEHAVRLAARITALGGTPASQEVESQPAGGTLTAWLTQDLVAEQWAIVEYARLVASVMDDSSTVELMTELLMDEIRHAGWLKSTLHGLEVKL